MKKGNLKILLLVVIAVVLMTLLWTSLGKTERTWEVDEVYIRKGDTLWGIAKVHCPNDMDMRKWIHEVKELNNRKTADIYEGEIIKILILDRKNRLLHGPGEYEVSRKP